MTWQVEVERVLPVSVLADAVFHGQVKLKASYTSSLRPDTLVA